MACAACCPSTSSGRSQWHALPVARTCPLCAASSHTCRHGQGKLVHRGYKYEGEWVGDRQHGAGRCVTDGGDRYVGRSPAPPPPHKKKRQILNVN
jgi:hypothetical protein